MFGKRRGSAPIVMKKRDMLFALPILLTTVKSAIGQHVNSTANPHKAPANQQVFRFGPRLHHLIYETAVSAHNPLKVIQFLCLVCLSAKSVALDHNTMIVTGLDSWGRERLQEIIDSYKG